MKTDRKHRLIKRIVIVFSVVIYLVMSYELKVVRGYNSGYKHLGISDDQIVIGAAIVIVFIITDLYKKYRNKDWSLGQF